MTEQTINRIRQFTADRDWDQFHTPAKLAKGNGLKTIAFPLISAGVVWGTGVRICEGRLFRIFLRIKLYRKYQMFNVKISRFYQMLAFSIKIL